MAIASNYDPKDDARHVKFINCLYLLIRLNIDHTFVLAQIKLYNNSHAKISQKRVNFNHLIEAEYLK